MYRRRASALLMFLATALPSAAQPRPPVVRVELFSCEKGPFALRLPKQLPRLMKLAPVEREEFYGEDEWEGYVVSRKYVFFRGLTLGLVTFAADPQRYLLTYAEIAHPRWADLSPLRLGSPAALLHFQLGADAGTDPQLRAVYGNATGDVSFVLAGGRVTKLRYVCYNG
jgi:hypothetical protein